MLDVGISLTSPRTAGSPYDPAAVAYFAAMSVQPDATRKALINTLILGLKSDGVWSLLDWLSLVAAHDAQAGRINAKTPAQVATANGTITFTTDRGYLGDGTSGYLDTLVADNAAGLTFAQNSAAIFAYINSGTPARAFGLSASANSRLTPIATGTRNAVVNGGTASTGVVSDGLGLTTGTRTDALTVTAYSGGVALVPNVASASSALTGSTFTALKGNITFGAGQIAAFGFGGALNGTQVAAFNTRLVTYLAALGAN